tara:strand:+ start:196 stop:456 length:261 start_codon:yes stop_codon:yes gene_type:complete
MPKYFYKCLEEECQYVFETVHSMKKKLTECDQCSGSVERIPLNEVNVAKPPNASPTKTGSVVKKNIEEFRKALKEEKKRLSKVEYK